MTQQDTEGSSHGLLWGTIMSAWQN